MKFYNYIHYWSNKYRLEKLRYFRELLLEYKSNISFSFLSLGGVSENNNAIELHVKINNILIEVDQIILAAGVSETLNNKILGDYDVVLNVFNFNDNESLFKGNYPALMDTVERAIGVYISDKKKSILRSFNPFFWLGYILECVVALPFKFVGMLFGFDSAKAETSPIGKLIKGLESIILILAAILAIMHYLGYL